MNMNTVTAIFEHGTFRPEKPFDLPEGSRVTIAVGPLTASVAPPDLTTEERRKVRTRVVERMMRNPLPPDAPHFSRNDMYNRD